MLDETNTQPSSLKDNHLMTDPKGNSEFCFPKPLEGKENLLFPVGPVMKCFDI